jgi:perosamine synthetase
MTAATNKGGTMELFGKAELDNLKTVIETGELWRGLEGRFTAQFEEAFGKWLGREYVYAVCSGTCAEETAVASLGLAPGDEVICPATAPIFVSFPVIAVGCIPVFADVDPRTMIISPEGIEERITERTRAVMVVHLFGQPAPMDEIMAVAKKHDLKVVEDCAQAFGCTHRGRKVGSIGDATCFSLQQSKHITSGEGGIFATDDPEIYKRAILFANCGMPWFRHGLEAPEAKPLGGIPTRGHFGFGHNYRMNELQGAVCVAQLARIDEYNRRREEVVRIIEDGLRDVKGVELAHVYPDTKPIYWTYPIRMPAPLGDYGEINYLEVEFQRMNRDRRTALGVPLPDYVRYEPGLCPEAEKAAKRMQSLGVHHGMTDETARNQVDDVKRFLAKNAR